MVDVPEGEQSFDMPVKLRGQFTTSVPKADLKDGSQVFNYVSWTDPKSADITKPDVYSVACVAGYSASK